MLNKRFLFAIVVMMSLLITSIAGVTAQDERPELIVAVQALPPTLEPIRENSNVMERIRFSIFGTLLELDTQTFELVPGLAESWERIDDRTVELKLREGVLFHNGDTLDAEDVVFTFGPERAFNEEFAGYGNAQQFFGTFESVEAVDDLTVRFTANQPDPLLEQRLTVATSGIISKTAFEEAEDYDIFSQQGIGTGPYQVVEYVADDVLVLEPFEEYYDGTPTLSRLTFQIVPEASARIAGLIAGDYDIITDVPPDQLSVIDEANGVNVAGGAIRNNRVIIYNETDPVLADPLLRRALNVAIDRQLIVDALYDGRTEVPPGNQFSYYGDMFLEDWEPVAYDPELAKELVAESDYNGEEIIYRTQPGYYTFQGETAEILQQMWQAVGINVTVEFKENWDQVLADGIQIVDYSTTMMYPDPVGHLCRLWGERGYIHTSGMFSNDEFIENCNLLETNTDLETRREAFRRAMEIYQNEDPSGTYLHQLTIFYGVRDGIDWVPTVYEFMDLRPGKFSIDN